MSISSKVLCLMACLVGASTVQAGTPKAFSFRAEVPATVTSCEDHAKALANAFGGVTKAQVTASSCAGENTFKDKGVNYSRHILKVDYLANWELIPSKAIFGGQNFMGAINEHTGFIGSYAECVAQIPAQVANYQRETGLLALVSYCEKTPYPAGTPYSLVIEGFGNPQKKLWGYAQPLLLGEMQSLDILRAELTVLADAGASIVYHDDTRAYYYSKNSVYVSERTLAYLHDVKQCELQKPVVAAIYSNAGVASVTPLCLPTGSLMVISGDMSKIHERQSSDEPVYNSFNDCMNDRDRMIQNFKSKGWNPLGVVCDTSTYSREQFVSRLFYK